MPTLSQVVADGDHRSSLEALRDELAAGMEQADANVKPQYAARLQAVLAELAALPSPKRSKLDELRATDTGSRPKRRRRTEQR